VKIPDADDLDEPSANLTPLIDIVFNLLLFYLVSTTFLDEERALDIDLPGASTARELPPEELVIHVLADGSVVMGGDTVDEATLLARLRERAASAPDTPVTIRGHRATRHEAIVGVMDACGAAGLTNLSIGTAAEDRG
jgi:biopolymer transport protein ExbD